MRIAKWISRVIFGLGLAMGAQAALAGLFEAQPGACNPVKACAPVTKVERLPPACEPVQVYVPHIKPCGPVEAVNACGPVNTQETVHLPFVFAHLGYKVDRLLHVTAYKLKASKHSGYAKEYSPAPCAPAAPVSTAPASTLPPAPTAGNHS